jgi:serine/threonine-protein kinase PknG
VYGEVPGELAPKLALALACEISDAGDVAERLYSTCAACDANYVAPASFAIARLRATRGDTRGALAALDQVPETSRAYVQARRIRAELLTAAGGFDELAEALDSVAAVSLDPTDAASLRLRVFETAHGRLVTGATTSRAELGGVPLDDKALRVAIEETYRHLADLEPDKQRRMELVDAANKSRPWTVV